MNWCRKKSDDKVGSMSTSRSHELDFMNENLNGEKAHLEAPLIMDKDSRRQESEEDVSAGDDNKLLHKLKPCIVRIVQAYCDSYVWLILTASVGFALTLTCIKMLSEQVSVFQVTAVRASMSTVALFAICWWNGISLFQPRERLPLMIARGVTGASAFVCMALATFELPLSDSAFMSNSYPIVTAVLSWLFGMEQLGVLSWSGIAGCVIGNALVAHPPFLFGGRSDWGPKRLIGITAAIFANLLMGAAFVLVRYIGKSVDSVVLTAYLHLFSVIVSLPFLFASYPKPVNTRHAWRELMCYAATILAGVFGQLAQSRALQIGPPTKTTTLLMTNMLLAGTIGVVALSESMTWLSFVGAGIIIISVMVVTMQDSTKQPRCDGYQQFLPESDEGTP